jgi:hypothetical protein
MSGICGQRGDAGDNEAMTRRREKRERSAASAMRVRNVAGPRRVLLTSERLHPQVRHALLLATKPRRKGFV